MKKSAQKKDGIPVSQAQLAEYLGISKALMSMGHGRGKHYRMLPVEASSKLSSLEIDFLMSEKLRKPGRSLLKINEAADKACKKIANTKLEDARYFELKADILQSKLDVMSQAYNQDQRWLNLIDERLAAIPPGKKRSEREYLWFSYQQVLASERLEKNGMIAQVKLATEIETAKAMAAVNNAMNKKIMKMLS